MLKEAKNIVEGWFFGLDKKRQVSVIIGLDSLEDSQTVLRYCAECLATGGVLFPVLHDLEEDMKHYLIAKYGGFKTHHHPEGLTVSVETPKYFVGSTEVKTIVAAPTLEEALMDLILRIRANVILEKLTTLVEEFLNRELHPVDRMLVYAHGSICAPAKYEGILSLGTTPEGTGKVKSTDEVIRNGD